MDDNGFVAKIFPIHVTSSGLKDEPVFTTTYFDYLKTKQKSPWWSKVKAWIKKKFSSEEQTVRGGKPATFDPYEMTKKEDEIAKAIKARIDCTVDKKTNVITIVVEDQDPLIAATMADSIQTHLQYVITDYRTKKARNDVEYMQKLYEEAHQQYTKARQKYAGFGDANSKVALQSVQSMLDELENEMQLKYNIYQQVVEQLQLAKAKVQERTPAFTIVQNATVPIKHSSRPKIVTLIIWMFLGFLVRCGMLAWRNRNQFITL
jgi:uncharacterized protein involved in exopolysaccharide biosynthesis